LVILELFIYTYIHILSIYFDVAILIVSDLLTKSNDALRANYI